MKEKSFADYEPEENRGWKFLAPTWDEEVQGAFPAKLPAILDEVNGEVNEAFPFSVS
jgi:hypothetical protein